ncbi:phenylacetate-CoA oxygenase/reductase subunit PaaK [Nocardioides humilatus]|uniref:Phenylacetate-CoA oxygenase/reductase subunit PaaK n=1 Tax=Nocardioides humilatus TaxID=2607660 RepID=A0A5B1LF47_9ACTN|nr:1,2-phenylacetyl-CoA epoxidase subunit PaaE [Nocardioides humilatus]KAA1418954.1 phenylacetate-CoA oxygenase/reductase subunit PaaK [Nocardioides humilatus]
MSAGATQVAEARTTFHPLAVAAVERLTDDAAAVSFVVPPELAEAYAFAPGQAVVLRRTIEGVEHRRHYSICAPAGAPLRIGVREVPDGLFSRWLVHDLRPGDLVEVATPTGSFHADPEEGGRHLCIAAGSGITPMLSIATSVLATPSSQVTLLYGNRTTSTVMFADELSDLKNVHPARFELVHVLSREPRDVELFTGRLDAERLRRILTTLVPIDVDHVWLCGPFAMLADARAVLGELGIPADRVHVELFYVDEPPPPVHHADRVVEGITSEVAVMLDGRLTTTAVPRDRRILDAVQEVRSDLPFACKGGVCGTCRARVVEGEVEMVRNYALEPDEVERGFVLTCQSLPVSDRVGVDFDA